MLSRNNIDILNWSGTFPDLNVIENIWNIIDRKLPNYRPRTVNDLQQIILRLWSEISIKTCEKLVQTMSRHLQDCIRMRGKTSSEY